MKKIMPEDPSETPPLNPIRVETALPRYPIHRLAKHGDISIDIRERNAAGEVTIRWEVDYGKKHGQPGPLAYKLDTLIINRRIEEAARPMPRMIRLGSLREICRELGINEGKATQNVKDAIYQNASAFITAKISYRQTGGKEKTLEAGFNRYQVIFTGEELPGGRKADAVYIILSDVYMQVLNGAMTRPLDYDYLKSLPPAPQRFYELISYKLFAAIKNDLPRAKLLYSELCTYAPLTRQKDWEHARKQLAKIHAPHKKSGYIASVEFNDAVSCDGTPDWIMCYQPGPKARAEYRAFTKRGGPVMLQVEPVSQSTAVFAVSGQPALPLDYPQPSPQEAALMSYGITPALACDLASQHDATLIATYIEYLEFEISRKPGKILDPAAWLFSAFKKGRGKPKGFTSQDERDRLAAVKRQREEDDAAARRHRLEQDAAEKAERQRVNAYRKSLTPDQLAEHEAMAIAQADPATRELLEQTQERAMRRMLLGSILDGYIGRLLQGSVELV